mgnify:CR=1 FL=1
MYQENEILHSPRIRNDISSIYFLTDYELGKTIVPIFRSYSLDINFYSSTEIFHEANDIKKDAVTFLYRENEGDEALIVNAICKPTDFLYHDFKEVNKFSDIIN